MKPFLFRMILAAGACSVFVLANAADDGASLETCLTEASDYSAVYPTQTFPAGSTREVAAVLRLAKGESYPGLTATWIAVSVPGYKPNSELKRIEMDLRGKDRAVVRFAHALGLPAGAYRLDVGRPGKPWKSADFRVAPVAAPALKQSADMMPLAVSTQWRYGLTQEFGPNIRPQMPPGTKLDADGKFRAGTTVAVVGSNASGMHVETRQNGELVNEEWMQLGDGGLVITKIRSGGDESDFKPPHPLWPWPLVTPKEWFYEDREKTFKQRFRMWGPLPITGPAGEAPGYVVVMQQPAGDVSVTVERRYLPGIGLVRESITQGRNGKLVTRTTMELSAAPVRTAP